MSSAPLIEVQSVTKRYAGRSVLAEVSLELGAASTYVLLGPSGCGKSTLLRLIIGLIRPDEGLVRVRGATITAANVLELRRSMGYVIQDGGLFPHLTARQNTALVAAYLGWTKDRMEQRLRELAELTHFPHDGLDRFPSQLSGGQRQRVGLMRALMLDPAVLLLDEPLGALDPMIRHDLQTDLREIFRSLKKTVVLVTHDLHEAAGFADEIILLREGRIVQRGSLEKLVQEPAEPFVTRFVNAQRSFAGV
jgi:osmoprotectant transport system ATP-binding protein